MTLRSARAALQAAHEIAFYYGSEELSKKPPKNWAIDAIAEGVHDIWRENPLTGEPTSREAGKFEGLTEGEKDKDRAYAKSAAERLLSQIKDGAYEGPPTELIETWLYLDQNRCNQLSRRLGHSQSVSVALPGDGTANIWLISDGRPTFHAAPLLEAAGFLREWSDRLTSMNRSFT